MYYQGGKHPPCCLSLYSNQGLLAVTNVPFRPGSAAALKRTYSSAVSVPSARGGAAPELLPALVPPARGVLLCTDDAWPFSSVSLLLPAALASAIATCTCMCKELPPLARHQETMPSVVGPDNAVVSQEVVRAAARVSETGTDLLCCMPQDLLNLGSDSSHCSRLQLPEFARISC